MIVNIDQIRIGVKKYVENELAQKANGVTKFMIYFMLPGIDKQTIEYVNSMQTNEIFSEMFDENKNVYLDKLHERATFAIEKSGNKLFIQKYGISLDKSDVDKIYTYIKES